MKSLPHALLLLSILAIFAGCISLYETRRGQSSNVADFLFPDKIELNEQERLPRLELPLRVGVAFVPPARNIRQPMSAREQEDLAQRVADEFEALDFVDSITVIPGTYLRQGGSFDNLDQIRRMFGVDAIALLGYDQFQTMDSTFASVAVWTIVGAYIIPSERTGTHTLMEAVIYDIPTRSLLFRAPGTSEIEGRLSTAVSQERRIREDSEEGFRLATESLITNLEDALDRFQKRVKERPDDYVVVHRPGYSGVSNLGWSGFLMATILLVFAARKQRQ